MVHRDGAARSAGRRTRWITRLAATGAVFAASTVLAPLDGAQARPPFVPGTATATSQALQVAPSTGGLAATITVGASIADYRGSLAQASSQTVDLGLVGTDLTVQCSASVPPTLKASQLPQPLIAESDKGNARATKNTAGTGQSGLVATAGRESVVATTTPQSIANFQGNTVVLPRLMTLSGLTSSSHTHLIAGRARIATASSEVGQVSLLGGAVKLSGLRWSATQRTGAKPVNHGEFTMQSATIAGRPLPVVGANTASTLATINKALTSTGLHLNGPAVTRHHGILAVSPLTVGIDKSALGGKVINPLLGAVQPVTDALATALTGVACQIGNVLTLADLALSATDGTGGVDLELGGATATSADKTYADPFGHHPKLGGHTPTGEHSTTTTTPGRESSGGAVGTSSGDGAGAPSGSPGSAGSPGQPVADSSSVSSNCSSLSPAHRPGCSRGSGLTVGLIALAAVAGFGGADAVVMRRRRRREAL